LGNPPLRGGRLALERFGQFPLQTVVSLGGLEIGGVVLHGANDVWGLLFWNVDPG